VEKRRNWNKRSERWREGKCIQRVNLVANGKSMAQACKEAEIVKLTEI
jgi:hypothetical protein